MASGDLFFNQELAAAAAMTGENYGRYFASSVHGFPHFQHAGSAPSGVADLGYIVPGVGMVPANFVMPEGALEAAGYGAPRAVPVEIRVAGRPMLPAVVHAGAVTPSRGVWTDEEDEILRKMVAQLGDRKWAAIAQHLPGRIGKQCRERWTNHLRPDLRKENIWTEDDDRVLIQAHKVYGNRWSAIARCLPGRSENAVKNHWNATKRSLKSKRRLKKKKSEQAGPGQLTLLEEYIRKNTPSTEPTAPPSVSPLPSGLGYDDAAGPHAAAHELAGSSSPGMGMYLQPANAARSSSYGGTMNLNSPSSLPDLNAYGGEMQERFYHSSTFPPYNNNLHYGLQEPLPAPALPLMFSAQEQLQAACMNLNLFPIADQNLASNGQSRDMAYGVDHYDSETGPSSAGGSGDPDDMEDVVQMASRQFLTPSEEEVTLNLSRFE